MFYVLREGGLTETAEPEEASVCVLHLDQIRGLEADFPFLRYRGPIRYTKADTYPGVVWGTLHIPDRGTAGSVYFDLLFAMTESIFYLIGTSQPAVDLAKKTLGKLRSNTLTLERVVGEFFAILLMDNFPFLEDLEARINGMEEEALRQSFDSFSEAMLTLRKELLHLRRYYEQMENLGTLLLENEANLFSKEGLRFLRRFTAHARGLEDSTQMLREYSMQVQEIYQAQVDIRQNKTMALLTVVTTIFLPLTLIAGWYGMNFDMPEFGWKYGYPLVILASLLVLFFLIWYFKRKKYF